jgi:hypothetical protein
MRRACLSIRGSKAPSPKISLEGKEGHFRWLAAIYGSSRYFKVKRRASKEDPEFPTFWIDPSTKSVLSKSPLLPN